MTATCFRIQRLVALILTLFASPHNAVGDCAMGYSTLTTEKCRRCGDFDLCLGYATTNKCRGVGCKMDGDCSYQCMAVDANRTTLDVLIEFGRNQSTQETAMGGFPTADLAGSVTDLKPSVSNDDVTAVATIDLSNAAKSFTMSGGRATEIYPKGQVSRVTITSNFIASATAVVRVVLQNLGLENQANYLSSFLPSTVKHLELTNTLLSTFPANLGKLRALEQLLLDYNYITTVEPSDAIDSVTTLSLKGNSIETFTSVFSNLKYLSLSENVLTSVPAAIYEHTNLNTLNLTGNAFAVREFTQDQAAFLNNLETLYLSVSDFTVELECDDSDQVAIHDVIVCLKSKVTPSFTNSSAAKTDNIRENNMPPNSTTVEATFFRISGSSSGSSGWFVWMICSVSGVLFGVFLFVFYRQRQKNKLPSKLENPLGFTVTCSSNPSDHSLQQSYGGLQSSAASNTDIPMEATELSIDDLTARGDVDVNNIIKPAFVNGNVGNPPSVQESSAYLSSTSTDTNCGEFTSIWNDSDLLSLQVRAANVKDIKPLGTGAFTMVWLVHYRETQTLAAKRLRPEMRTKKEIAMFVEEIKLIAKFDHPNLVKFVGAAWTMESDLQMLLEYMDKGNLRSFLADSNTPVGWTLKKLEIAVAVIEALIYLHSYLPTCVHCNLNSNNVLLSSDSKVKLSDFGASQFRPASNATTGGRWLAPEVIRGDTDYSPAADIYSFGALLTELNSNKIPYSDARGLNGKTLPDSMVVHQVATARLRPTIESDSSPALKDLVERCLVEDRTKRPAATTIALELRMIQKDMAVQVPSRSTNLRISELV